MHSQRGPGWWFLLVAVLAPLSCSDAQLLGTCRADMFLVSIVATGDDLVLNTNSGVRAGEAPNSRAELLVLAKNGGGFRTLAAVENRDPGNVVASGDRLVWSEGRDLVSSPRAGGELVTHLAGEPITSGLAVRDGFAYYAVNTDPDAGSWLACPNNGAIRRVPLDGGAPVTLVSGLTYPPSSNLVAGDERLFWIDDFGQDVDTRDAGGSVGLVGCFDVPRLVSMPLAGGPLRVVAMEVEMVGPAADESRVYALAPSSDGWRIVAYPMDGSEPTQLSVASDVVTTNSSAVFWLENFGEQGIYRAPKSGGPRQRMPTPKNVEAFAVDDNWLFYGRRGETRDMAYEVWRVPIPR